MRKKLNILIFLCLIQHLCFSQDRPLIDSLQKVFNSTKVDSIKINAALGLTEQFYQFKNDSAFYYLNFAKSKIDITELELKYKIYYWLSLINRRKGRKDLALDYAFKNLKIAENNEWIDKKIHTYLDIVWLYYELEKKEKEFEYYELAINEARKSKKKDLIFMVLETGTNIYFNIEDYDKSLELHKEKLKYDSLLIYDAGYIAAIGDVYRNKGIYDTASEYYLKAIAISEKKKDSLTLQMLYHNYGTIPGAQKNYKFAIECYLKSKRIALLTKTYRLVAEDNETIARLYFLIGDYKNALLYLNEAIEFNFANKNYNELQDQYETKSALLGNLKNYEGAYEYLLKSIEIKDSISNKTTQNKLSELESSIVEEKKQKEIEIINKEKELQKTIRNSFVVGFGLVLLLAGVSYRNFRRKKKDNKIITLQKELVEEKQKEILDSIEYALRIQTAILPPNKIVKKYLENSFILYKPKDIVAGDFYWMETVDDLVLFAACDCTGHGVPGAMVSVVCHNALNRAVKEFGLIQPAAILDKTAEIVIENFSKSEEDIKDGMDISLCAYNVKTKTIQWAGANNPLWLLQNGEFLETKADKQPIGMNEDSKPFTNHTFNLNSTDTIYLFTDGFADQFGGDTGQKKLTKKRFKDLILSVQNKSLPEQGTALDKFITDYRKEIEQIDDILVIGVKI